ncbi:MAG: fatty acid desaturase [Verrucomicrobiales bacterium]|nr:fatty acid desaturase [Verrucomicrobiales bacterium]
MVALTFAQGVVVLTWPSVWLISLAILWNSNTIAHYFIHLPFFEQRFWNRCFSLYQTLLLGIPQRLWRDRHLAHHASVLARPRWSGQLVFEGVTVLLLWACLVTFAPRFFFQVYVPGYLLGLFFCFVHGHYEHAQGTTTSHYGWLYNRIFFNDGYHIEHHMEPRVHWRALPLRRAPNGCSSAWPATLRWIESVNLQFLERVVLHSKMLQNFVLLRHEQAFQSLLPSGERPSIRQVGIVGGGLFPRTALILRKLLPHANICVIEEKPRHIEIARPWTDHFVEYVSAHYDASYPGRFDLVVIPLAFCGDREGLRRHPPARLLFVHDWIWRSGKRSEVISRLLLKRLNRVDA